MSIVFQDLYSSIRGILVFIISLILIVLMYAPAGAVDQKQTLDALISSLRKNPNDSTLRTDIIKFVREMNPTPEIPADAKKFVSNAESAFQKAKTNADYLAIAREFETALLLAPWVADYYYNLAVIYEKAARPNEAKRNYELYLVADPGSREKSTIIKHIAELGNADGKSGKKGESRDLKRDELLTNALQRPPAGAWAMSFFIGLFTPFLGSGQYYAQSYGSAVFTTIVGFVSYGIFLGGVIPEDNISQSKMKSKRNMVIAGGTIFTATWIFDWIYAPLATMKYNENIAKKYLSSNEQIVPVVAYIPRCTSSSGSIDHTFRLGLSMQW